MCGHCNTYMHLCYMHLFCDAAQFEVSPKEALMKLLELPPDIVSDTQRWELLMSAYDRQNNITVQFVKVHIIQ